MESHTSCEQQRGSEPRVCGKGEENSKSLAHAVEWRKSWSDCVAAFACFQTAPRKGMSGLHSPSSPHLCFSNTHCQHSNVQEAAYQKQQRTETFEAHGPDLLASSGGSGTGRQYIKIHTAMRQCLLCRLESTAMQSFKSDTGGRKGLSLLQREKGERSGMGRQRGVVVGAGKESVCVCVVWGVGTLHSDEIK